MSRRLSCSPAKSADRIRSAVTISSALLFSGSAGSLFSYLRLRLNTSEGSSKGHIDRPISTSSTISSESNDSLIDPPPPAEQICPLENITPRLTLLRILNWVGGRKSTPDLKSHRHRGRQCHAVFPRAITTVCDTLARPTVMHFRR